MNLSTAVPSFNRLRNRWAPKYTLLLVLGLAGLLAWVVWQGWAAYQATQLPGTPASAALVEARYGIRLTHIAVLADGGLVDLRFQIIDPDKAAPLFNVETRPILYVEQTGQKVDSLYHPPHGHDLVAGQSQYFLYNDQAGAIKHGSLVSLKLGDLRLEHIVAH